MVVVVELNLICPFYIFYTPQRRLSEHSCALHSCALLSSSPRSRPIKSLHVDVLPLKKASTNGHGVDLFEMHSLSSVSQVGTETWALKSDSKHAYLFHVSLENLRLRSWQP